MGRTLGVATARATNLESGIEELGEGKNELTINLPPRGSIV